MSDELRIGVVGAGATGGYLAARLTRAGQRVVLFARGDSVTAIRDGGIRVEDVDGSRWTARPERVVRAGEAVEPVPVALFCVKVHQTEQAAGDAAGLLGDSGVLVGLQNGVGTEELLAERYGAERVLPGVVYVGAERTAPGQVSCTAPARVIFGPYHAGAPVPGVARRLRLALADAGVDCSLTEQIWSAKWQKFVFNCGLNPVTALTRRPLGEVLACEEGRAVFEGLVDEAIAAARATGAPLPEDARQQVMEVAARMNILSSMAKDLLSGRALEVDAFGVQVLRLSERAGLDAPVTRTVTRLLAAVDPGRAA